MVLIKRPFFIILVGVFFVYFLRFLGGLFLIVLLCSFFSSLSFSLLIHAVFLTPYSSSLQGREHWYSRRLALPHWQPRLFRQHRPTSCRRPPGDSATQESRLPIGTCPLNTSPPTQTHTCCCFCFNVNKTSKKKADSLQPAPRTRPPLSTLNSRNTQTTHCTLTARMKRRRKRTTTL